MSRKIIIEEDKLQEILDAVEGKNLNLYPLLIDILHRSKCKIEICPDLGDSTMLYCFAYFDGYKEEEKVCVGSGLAGYANDFCREIIIGMVKYSLELYNTLKNKI